MASLENIWDAPADPSPRQDDDVHRPSKRQKTRALFLSDSEDEQTGRLRRDVIKAPPPAPTMDDDVEALFADAENDEGLSFKRIEALDVDAMEREAEARHRRNMPLTPHPVMPSSSPARDAGASGNQGPDDRSKEKDTKKRRKPMLLNENLLLGATGFPDLIDELKYFKAKGKGREAEDLTRLMRIYHFWTHKLYPKTKFRDTVVRIEKLCHSKRMQVALSVWRDEAHGKTREHDTVLDLDSDQDQDQADDDATASNSTTQPLRGHSSERPSKPHPPSSEPDTDWDQFGQLPTSSHPPDNGTNFPDNNDDLFSTSTSSKSKPGNASRPTASITTTATKKRMVPDDDEDENFWKESEAATALQQQPPQKSHSQPVDPDDEEMWAALEDVAKQSSAAPSKVHDQSRVASTRVDEMDMDDDDLWDIVRENENPIPPTSANAVSALVSKTTPDAERSLAESEMDWDDMYAD